MSAISQRKRRDRHIRAEVKAIADMASLTAWDEFRTALNAMPFHVRFAKAVRLACGVLS